MFDPPASGRDQNGLRTMSFRSKTAPRVSSARATPSCHVVQPRSWITPPSACGPQWTVSTARVKKVIVPSHFGR